jgi:hypothetical protein
MSNEVYANGREISCKAAAGKSICAFPDVCLTPPPPPAGPIPIPYPNTGMASDTDGGSKTVQISGQEVMLKDSSDFKKSTGDEAATKAQGMSVITHQIQGKCYFTAWSMDVKIESENAVRHLDMMTHNHASMPGSTPPWPYTDAAAMSAADQKKCEADKNKEKKACSGPDGEYKSADDCCKDDKCQEARNCMLVPYGGAGSPNCCPGKTGHHLMPNSLLQSTRGNSGTNVPGLTDTYNVNDGPCVCVKGGGHTETHGELHERSKEKLRGVLESGKPLTYDVAKTKVSEAHSETFPGQCNQECIEAQIDASLKSHKSGKPIEVRQKDGITRKNFESYGDQD